MIEIDVDARSIELKVPEEILEERRKCFVPVEKSKAGISEDIQKNQRICIQGSSCRIKNTKRRSFEKMKKKRMLAALLAGSMLLTACGGTGGANSVTGT